MPPSETTSLLRLRGSSQPFPLHVADTWFGDVVVISNSGEPASTSMGCANAALIVLAVAPVAATVLGIVIDEPDFARVMAILAAIFIPLAIYVWWAARRFWRIGRLINRGEFDRAQSAIGEWQSATFGPLAGLLAQLRNDHDQAAKAFGWTVSAFHGPAANLPAVGPAAAAGQAGRELALGTPTARATMLRAAIAFTNVGRFDEARALIAAGGTVGSYCGAIERIASAYLALCTGQPLFPDRNAAMAMAGQFRPIRGAWGGLSLAACGLQQFGDAEGARALVEEEASRPGAEYIRCVLPRLGSALSGLDHPRR